MLYDTHVHFGSAEGEYALDAVMTRAQTAGVGRLLAVGGSEELNRFAIKAANSYPDIVSLALGFDRDQAVELAENPDTLEKAIDYLRVSFGRLTKEGIRFGAIGEIGLDYHYSRDTSKKQICLLNAQLALARELDLPVIIHSREADEDTLNALKKHREESNISADRIGVLHCFTGNKQFASELLKLGYYISFSGIVTFRNADPLRSVAGIIPEDKLLIETDSPFLAPAPKRGKRNEPAFVAHVAEKLAEVRGTITEEICRITYENAVRLFSV